MSSGASCPSSRGIPRPRLERSTLFRWSPVDLQVEAYHRQSDVCFSTSNRARGVHSEKAETGYAAPSNLRAKKEGLGWEIPMNLVRVTWPCSDRRSHALPPPSLPHWSRPSPAPPEAPSHRAGPGNAEDGRRFRYDRTYPHSVWLNPVAQKHWDYSESTTIIRRLFSERMYPITIEGLEGAMKELVR